MIEPVPSGAVDVPATPEPAPNLVELADDAVCGDGCTDVDDCPVADPEPARCGATYDLSDGPDGVLVAHCGETEPGHDRHMNARYGIVWSELPASVRAASIFVSTRAERIAAEADATAEKHRQALDQDAKVRAASTTAASSKAARAERHGRCAAADCDACDGQGGSAAASATTADTSGDLRDAMTQHAGMFEFNGRLHVEIARLIDELVGIAEAALAARDAEHADALTLERATYASGTITLGVGPEGCQPGEWDCEEYFDNDGNQLPGVERCSHITDDVWTADRLVELIEKVDVLERTAAARDAELAKYEPLTLQGCPIGRHLDWLVDRPDHYKCPWCQIEARDAELVEQRRHAGAAFGRAEANGAALREARAGLRARDYELWRLREENATLIAGWHARSQLDQHAHAVRDDPNHCPPCATYLAASYPDAMDEMRCDWAQERIPAYDAAHNIAITASPDEECCDDD